MKTAQNHPVILPGIKPVLELLRDNPAGIEKIIYRKTLNSKESAQIISLATANAIPLETASTEFLEHICKSTHISHQGIVAFLAPWHNIPFTGLLQKTHAAPLPLLIALDQVQDTGNLGAIARTAYALGCGGLVISEDASARPGPGAYRASAGALAKMPLTIIHSLVRALDEAAENDFTIYGTIALKDCPKNLRTENIWNVPWKFPCMIVLGNESRGIRTSILKRCTDLLTIPFERPFNSLNISQAAAIFISQAYAYYLHSNQKIMKKE